MAPTSVNVVSSTTIINGASSNTTISNPAISNPIYTETYNNYSFIVNQVNTGTTSSRIQLSRINNPINTVDIGPNFLSTTTTLKQNNPLIQNIDFNNKFVVSCIEDIGSNSNITLYLCDTSCNVVKTFIIATEPTTNPITSYEIDIFGVNLYLCYSVNNEVKISTVSIGSLLIDNTPSVFYYKLDPTGLPSTINRISFDVYAPTQMFIACGSDSATGEIKIALAITISGSSDPNAPLELSIPTRISTAIPSAFNPKFVMVNDDYGYLVFNTKNTNNKTNIGIMYFKESDNSIQWTEINNTTINTETGSQTSPSISVNNLDQLCISYTTDQLISLSKYPVNTTPSKDIVIAVVDNLNDNVTDTFNLVSIHQSTFWNTKNSNEDNSFIKFKIDDFGNVTYDVLYTTDTNKLTLMNINFSEEPLIRFGSFLSTYAYFSPELLGIYNNLKVLTYADFNFNKPYYDMPINKSTLDYIITNLQGALLYYFGINSQANRKKDLNSDYANDIVQSGYFPNTTKSEIEEVNSLFKTMDSTSFYYITLNTLKLVELMVSLFDSLNFDTTNPPPSEAPLDVYFNYKYILTINDKNVPVFIDTPLWTESIAAAARIAAARIAAARIASAPIADAPIADAPIADARNGPPPIYNAELTTATGYVILFQSLYKIISEGNITQYGADSFSKIFQLLQSSALGTTINEYIADFLGGGPTLINIIKNLLLENISLSSIRSLYNENHMYELDNNQKWLEVNPLPEPCYYSTTVSLNKNIYVIGGISCLLENFVTKPYASTMYMGTPTQGMRNARTALYLNRRNNDKAAIINRISVYNGTKWSIVAGTNIKRYCASSVVFKDKIYLIGGHTSFDTTFQHYEQKTTNAVEIKEKDSNFSKESWGSGNNLNKSRAGCSSVVFDEKIFVIGGYDDLGFGVAEIETLSNDSTSWSIATVTKDFNDYDFYGYSCSAAVFKNAIYILDCNGRLFKLKKNATGGYTLTNKFVQPYLSVSKNCKNSKLVLYNGRLYIVGGNEYSSPRTFQYFNGVNWFQGGNILPEKSFLLNSVVA
jgi:hypothetical protein